MASRPAALSFRAVRHIILQDALPSKRYTVCRACRIGAATQLNTPSRQSSKLQRQNTSRLFSTFRTLQKKSSTNPKSPRKSPAVEATHKNDTHIPDNKNTRNQDSEPDPYDHSALQSAIDDAIARLKDALTKTRDAGRVSVQMLEDLPVDLNIKGSSTQGGSAHKERTRIRDIASVVPKGGRTMQVFISEEAHAKPISNAIQASPYSLVPQPDQQNPLLLIVPVPPATAETRQQAAVEAKKCFDKASLDVRNARGDAQKRHKKMEQEKMVVPDELRKAHKGMEDVARKGQDDIKRVYDGALKALQNN